VFECLLDESASIRQSHVEDWHGQPQILPVLTLAGAAVKSTTTRARKDSFGLTAAMAAVALVVASLNIIMMEAAADPMVDNNVYVVVHFVAVEGVGPQQLVHLEDYSDCHFEGGSQPEEEGHRAKNEGKRSICLAR